MGKRGWIIVAVLALFGAGFGIWRMAADEGGGNASAVDGAAPLLQGMELTVGQPGEVHVDAEQRLVRIHVPAGASRGSVGAAFKLAQGVTISPEPPSQLSLNAPKVFKLSAKGGESQEWTVMAGTSGFTEQKLGAIKLNGAGKYGSMRTVTVEGQPFRTAYEVKTTQSSSNRGDLSLDIPAAGAYGGTQTVLLSFYARAVETTNEEQSIDMIARFEGANPANTFSLNMPVRISKDDGWKRVDIPFNMNANRPLSDGQAKASLWLAFAAPQTVQLAGFELYQYGQLEEQLKSKLPTLRFTYPGREPDAAWRAEAAKRIEQLRKADLTVDVVDGAGKPVPGASVSVAMKKHEFLFGTAVNVNRLFDASSDNAVLKKEKEQYRKHLSELFNEAVIGNELKMMQWETPGGRKLASRALNLLNELGYPQLGHTLIWQWPRFNSAEIQGLMKHPELLKRRLLSHIEAEMSTHRGQVKRWDVANEMANARAFFPVLGSNAIADWYTKARQTDSDVKLQVNDYDSTSRYLGVLQQMKETGAPLDIVGF